MLVVLSVVAGLGAGMLNPAQQASLADIVGRERNGGPALAAFQMSADSGAIIGPVLAGLLIDYGSYPLAFGMTGLITLLAVIPWLFARETHDVRHGATPDAAKDPADPHRLRDQGRRELTRRLSASGPSSGPGVRRRAGGVGAVRSLLPVRVHEQGQRRGEAGEDRADRHG